MANARSSGVLVVDTSAQFDGVYKIKAIKQVGQSAGTSTIKADSSSGQVIWTDSLTAANFEEVCMNIQDGMYVTCGTSAVLYIYLGD